jgi:uncharacterized membrane protein
MSKLKNWMDQNVDDTVSSNLNNFVADIIFKIWTSPYRIMAPLFKYFSNNEFKNILLLVWFILAFVTIIIVTILNYALDDFSSLEWFIAIIINSILLMVLNGIVKIPKVHDTRTQQADEESEESEEPEEVETPNSTPAPQSQPEDEEDLSLLFGEEDLSDPPPEEEIVHDLRKPTVTIVENAPVNIGDELNMEEIISGSNETMDEYDEAIASLTQQLAESEDFDQYDDDDDDDGDF